MQNIGKIHTNRGSLLENAIRNSGVFIFDNTTNFFKWQICKTWNTAGSDKQLRTEQESTTQNLEKRTESYCPRAK